MTGAEELTWTQIFQFFGGLLGATAGVFALDIFNRVGEPKFLVFAILDLSLGFWMILKSDFLTDPETTHDETETDV